jgi:hypothetical protein
MDRPPPRHQRRVRQSSFDPDAVAELLTEYAKTTNSPSIRHFCATNKAPCPKILRKWELTHPGVMRAIGTLRYLAEVDAGKAA